MRPLPGHHGRATILTMRKPPRFVPVVPGIATVQRRPANGSRVVVKPRSGAHTCVQAKPVIRPDHDLLRRCGEGLSRAETGSEPGSGGGRPRGCDKTVTAVVSEARQMVCCTSVAAIAIASTSGAPAWRGE